MNCPDCVNILTREKVDGTVDNICLLDNRSVFAIKNCNRFKAIEIAIQIEPEKIRERLDQSKTAMEIIADKINPWESRRSGSETISENLIPKHRGWPKGKKRQV